MSLPRKRYPLHVASCPFCEKKPKISRFHGGDTGHRFAVSCENESCVAMPTVTGKTRPDTISRWNERGAK